MPVCESWIARRLRCVLGSMNVGLPSTTCNERTIRNCPAFAVDVLPFEPKQLALSEALGYGNGIEVHQSIACLSGRGQQLDRLGGCERFDGIARDPGRFRCARDVPRDQIPVDSDG